MTPTAKNDTPWWARFIEKFGISTVILVIVLWWSHLIAVELWHGAKQWATEFLRPVANKYLELLDNTIKSNNTANELLGEIQKTQLEIRTIQKQMADMLDLINGRIEQIHVDLKTGQEQCTDKVLQSLHGIDRKVSQPK